MSQKACKVGFSLSFLTKKKICIILDEEIRDIVLLESCCGENNGDFHVCDEHCFDEENLESIIKTEEEKLEKKYILFLECLKLNKKTKGVYVQYNKIFVLLRAMGARRWKEAVCDILSTLLLVLNPNLVLKEKKCNRLFSAELLKNKMEIEKICAEEQMTISLCFK